MKKGIKYILLASVAAVIAASCNKNNPPVFDDANAFIAFSSTSTSVSENGYTCMIPVSLASVAGLEGSATFTITENEVERDGKKFSPKEGVNYKVITEGGTLKFDAEHRTQYIEILGIPDGVYTGDLSITITLASSMNLGYAKTCTVTIIDEDHPLALILGKYEATSSGEATEKPWAMTIMKDKDDDHKVWIDNIFANSGWAGNDMLVYGVVTEEDGVLTKISVPCGQEMEYHYKSGGTSYPIYVFGLDVNDNLLEEGFIEIDIISDGTKVSLDFGETYGVYCGLSLGYIGYAYPQITAVKQ